jgi:uncharacterized protein
MRIAYASLIALGLSGAFTVAHAQDSQARLWDAALAGDTVAIKQALKDGANVHAIDTRRSMNGRRALNWAALGNHIGAVRVLIAAGASVDSANYTGFTPLHHAAEVGSFEAAQALLDAGAKPAALNGAGMTAAAVARDRGFTMVAELLEAAEKKKP